MWHQTLGLWTLGLVVYLVSFPTLGQSSEANRNADVVHEELFSRLSVVEEEIRQLRVANKTHSDNAKLVRGLREELDVLKTEIERLKGVASDSATYLSTQDASKTRSQTQNRIASGTNESNLYERAHELINAKKYKAAAKAFDKLLKRFPNGDYAGQSWYWRGELYIVQKPPVYKKAIMAFKHVVQEFPLDKKTPDSMYKLGTLYHQTGDRESATEWLNRVAQEYRQSAKPVSDLASAYLRKHDL